MNTVYLSLTTGMLSSSSWCGHCVYCREPAAIVKMSKTLALLKEMGVPSLLLDNQLNSATIKECESFFRSSFSSILQIHSIPLDYPLI